MSRRFRPLVVCYHAVAEDWPHDLAVRPGELERQLRGLLRRGYRAGTAAEALAGGRRRLHVTFDDAYTNVLQALPILRRLGVPATVFAATGFAATGRPLDVPELADEAARRPGDLATLDWDGLRALVEAGVEVGSHTVSHPHLPLLSDVEVERELRESRARLEDELARPCRFLAYPYGEAEPRVHAAARRAGYDAAFVLHGPSRPENRYALPRVDLYRGDSLARAMVKTSAVREPVWAVLDRLDPSRVPATA